LINKFVYNILTSLHHQKGVRHGLRKLDLLLLSRTLLTIRPRSLPVARSTILHTSGLPRERLLAAFCRMYACGQRLGQSSSGSGIAHAAPKPSSSEPIRLCHVAKRSSSIGTKTIITCTCPDEAVMGREMWCALPPKGLPVPIQGYANIA